MPPLKILKYPHPILRRCSESTTGVDASLHRLIQDMVDTMYDGPGAVGLAACQVGELVRVFVMDVSAKTTRDQLRVLINPQIVQQSRNKVMREGCLSFPDYLANIKRATRLTVAYMDEHGEAQEYQTQGLEAVCIQHELDHLDGVLMIDRINSLKTDWVRRKRPAEPMSPMDKTLNEDLKRAGDA